MKKPMYNFFPPSPPLMRYGDGKNLAGAYAALLLMRYQRLASQWLVKTLLLPMLLLLMGRIAFGQNCNPVQNGDFSVNSTWTLNGGWSYVNGGVQDSQDNANDVCQQTISNVRAGSTLSFTYRFGNGGGGLNGNSMNLRVSYAGTPYISITTSPYSSGAAATVTGLNGATVSVVGTPTAGVSVTINATLPASISSSGLLQFLANGPTSSGDPTNATDDIFIDNVVMQGTLPVITVQPTAPTVCSGANATYSVSATGTGLTYLWYYSDDNTNYSSLAPFAATYPGYNTATLTSPSNGGNRTYRVVVTNSIGCSVTSNAVGATVRTAPSGTITASPASFSICAPAGSSSANATGKTITANAPSGGTGPFTYDWQFNDGGGWVSLSNYASSYPGYDTNTLSFGAGSNETNGRRYRVVISNSCGSVTSSESVITVSSAPAAPTASVTSQPTCATPTGTVTINSPTGSNYSYSYGGLPYQSSNVFSGLAPGTYNFYSKDNTTGCQAGPGAAVTVNAAPTAPATPTLSATSAANVCPATTVDLTTLVTSTAPSGATLEFHTSSTPSAGNLVSNPTSAASGTYYAFYFNSTTGCYSPASAAITATTNACVSCAANAGTLTRQ